MAGSPDHERGNGENELSQYELQRNQNVSDNQRRLAELFGKDGPHLTRPSCPAGRPRAPRRPLALRPALPPPSRNSGRLSDLERVDYLERSPRKERATGAGPAKRRPAETPSGSADAGRSAGAAGSPATTPRDAVAGKRRHDASTRRPEHVATEYFRVIIPPNVRGGGDFGCRLPGSSDVRVVTVPMGMGPGMSLEVAVELPAAGPPSPSTPPRKRPMGGYQQHMSAELARLAQEHPELPQKQRFQLAAQLWSADGE